MEKPLEVLKTEIAELQAELERTKSALLRQQALTANLHQQELKAKEYQFDEVERIYHHAPVGLGLIDQEGRYLRINKRLAEMNGISAEAHIGRTLREIVPDIAEQAEALLRQVFETNEPIHGIEIKGETAAHPGVERVWEENWYPFKNSAGQTIAVNVVAEDITERKHAQDALRKAQADLRQAAESARMSERRLQLIADRAPVFIAYCGTDNTYKFVNQPYAERFGLPKMEIIGKTFAEVLGPEVAARIDPYVQRVLQGERVVYETQVSSGVMEPRYMWVAYEPELDDAGRVTGYVAAILDITERKQAEEALQAADRKKDEFLAMLAHELRNPLAPIRNAVLALKRIGPPDPRLQQMREVIDRQSELLARMVDDLLDVARITQGKIELRQESLELYAVVAQAMETSRPLIEARQHKLITSFSGESLKVKGDRARLSQVVANLLHNAAKYTDEGGHIWLSTERKGQEICLRVKDDGMGIPAQDLPHVFGLFAQAERSLDRAQGGLGIGLTLVKNIIEMHGGRVFALSEGAGKGSEFVVCLPLLQETTEQIVQEEERKTTADSKSCCRVLIVDDNEDSAQSLDLLLRLEGHQAKVAFDGPTALEVARQLRPHLIFLDIGLPGMNGYEVAKMLRQNPDFSKTILVALTGYGQSQDRARSKEAGFDHHLVKPVDYDKLLTLIESYVFE